MANPLFYVPATLRLDDFSVYQALAAQYQFGVPLIRVAGVSPQGFATLYVLTLYTTDTGVNSTTPGVLVDAFPLASPAVIVNGTAYPVGYSDPGGTLVGVNYVDAQGIIHPDVDWVWAISVEIYVNDGGVGTAAFDVAVINYTGTGVDGRLVPTPFSLLTSVGRSAVFVFPFGSREPSFRHNAMAPTVWSTGQPGNLVGGITSFAAGGFTVADVPASNLFTNQSGQKYTALVFRDTSPLPARYMDIGTYQGHGSFLTNGTFTNGTGTCVSGLNVSQLIGRLFTAQGDTYTITGTIDATHFAFVPNYIGTGGLQTISSVAGDLLQTIHTALGGIPTIVFAFGNGTVGYRSSEFTGGNSVLLNNSVAAGANTTLITALGADGLASFALGANDPINGSFACYYVAFYIPPGDAAEAVCKTYKVTGTGSLLPVTGFSFTPEYAAERPFLNAPNSCGWRGGWHTGSNANYFTSALGSSTGLIPAMALGSITLGVEAAPNGRDVYGFALATGTVPIGAPPHFVPVPPPWQDPRDVPPTGPPTFSPGPPPVPTPPIGPPYFPPGDGPDPTVHGCATNITDPQT